VKEAKRWVRKMSKMTEDFWESVPKSWCKIREGYEMVAELQRG